MLLRAKALLAGVRKNKFDAFGSVPESWKYLFLFFISKFLEDAKESIKWFNTFNQKCYNFKCETTKYLSTINYCNYW